MCRQLRRERESEREIVQNLVVSSNSYAIN